MFDVFGGKNARICRGWLKLSSCIPDILLSRVRRFPARGNKYRREKNEMDIGCTQRSFLQAWGIPLRFVSKKKKQSELVQMVGMNGTVSRSGSNSKR